MIAVSKCYHQKLNAASEHQITHWNWLSSVSSWILNKLSGCGRMGSIHYGLCLFSSSWFFFCLGIAQLLSQNPFLIFLSLCNVLDLNAVNDTSPTWLSFCVQSLIPQGQQTDQRHLRRERCRVPPIPPMDTLLQTPPPAPSRKRRSQGPSTLTAKTR